MADKPVQAVVKIQINAGQANPAPPVGTALGPHGLNIQEFCTKFNDATKDKMGNVIPCEITIYEDRTFDFILKTPPAAGLILKAAGLKKGSGKPNTEKAGTITKAHIKEIAELKAPDLSAGSVEAACKTIEGTARQMGITVID